MAAFDIRSGNPAGIAPVRVMDDKVVKQSITYGARRVQSPPFAATSHEGLFVCRSLLIAFLMRYSRCAAASSGRFSTKCERVDKMEIDG